MDDVSLHQEDSGNDATANQIEDNNNNQTEREAPVQECDPPKREHLAEDTVEGHRVKSGANRAKTPEQATGASIENIEESQPVTDANEVNGEEACKGEEGLCHGADTGETEDPKLVKGEGESEMEEHKNGKGQEVVKNGEIEKKKEELKEDKEKGRENNAKKEGKGGEIEKRKGDEEKRKDRKIKAGKGEAGKGEAGKGVAGKGVAGKGVAGKGEAGKGEAGKGVAGKGEAGKGEAGKGEAGKGVAGKGVAGKGEAGKGEAGKGVAGKGEAGKGEAGKGEAGKGEAGKGEAGKGEAGKGDGEAVKEEGGEAEAEEGKAPENKSKPVKEKEGAGGGKVKEKSKEVEKQGKTKRKSVLNPTASTPSSAAPSVIRPRISARSARMSRKNDIIAKFQQNAPETPVVRNFKLQRSSMAVASGTSIKQKVLSWCANKTRNYEGVSIENFSSSWCDGLAFCALIHRFFPDAFDFSALNASEKEKNFTLAFNTAETMADCYPLLEVGDMLLMGNRPDPMCVFTYVQALCHHLSKIEKEKKDKEEKEKKDTAEEKKSEKMTDREVETTTEKKEEESVGGENKGKDGKEKESEESSAVEGEKEKEEREVVVLVEGQA
uniref:Smoothelin-like 1 n=2 Tax=Oncorhynchus kisutch TaxID=8019 RepID=A0A8C7HGB9_ONCKI